MTREELEKEAVRKSLSYNTKYAEDGDFEDMLSRPQDFIEGSIVRMADLLRKKAYRDGMIDGSEPRERRIEELEKENAALKEQLGNKQMQSRKETSDFVWKLKTANEQKTDQLTKAKEIIKKYMRFKPVVGGVQYYHEEYEQTEKEAEQFLEEIKEND